MLDGGVQVFDDSHHPARQSDGAGDHDEVVHHAGLLFFVLRLFRCCSAIVIHLQLLGS